MLCVVAVDCPRNVNISPSNAWQAGTELTCTADSEPLAQFYWIEHNDNDEVHSGSTFKLKPGNYSLTCVAYINKTCAPGKPICRDKDSYADRRQNDTEFPFSIFNSTAPMYSSSISCEANNTVSGYAIGK